MQLLLLHVKSMRVLVSNGIITGTVGDESRKAYCQPPIIPGHEFVGEVVALGEGQYAVRTEHCYVSDYVQGLQFY